MKKNFFKLMILAGVLFTFSGCSFAGATRGGLCAASFLAFLTLSAISMLATSQKK